MRFVNSFLLNTGNTIKHLSLYYYGVTEDILSIPGSTALCTLSCLVHSAQRLLGEQMPRLRVITLHGIDGKQMLLHLPRKPCLRTALALDNLLLHLCSSFLTPALNTVQLHPFNVNNFYVHSWVLEEMSIYSYWGLHASDEMFRFQFVDDSGHNISPAGLQRTITRFVE